MKETKEARKERQALEEWQFVELLKAAGNRTQSEVPICKERKWRVDHLITHGSFGAAARRYTAALLKPIALEIEGFGRHHSWKGWLSDMDKYNSIAANGWLLVRVTREMIHDGRALDVLAACGVAVESTSLRSESK